MIKQTVMESTFIKMEPGTKGSGKMIFNMAKEKRFGQIIRCTRAIIMKVRNMERVSIFGKTDQVMKAIGSKIDKQM